MAIFVDRKLTVFYLTDSTDGANILPTLTTIDSYCYTMLDHNSEAPPAYARDRASYEQHLGHGPEIDDPFDNEDGDRIDETDTLSRRLAHPCMADAFLVNLHIKFIEPPWLRHKNKHFDTVIAKIHELIHVSPSMPFEFFLASVRGKLEQHHIITGALLEAGHQPYTRICVQRKSPGLFRSTKVKVFATEENWPDIVAALKSKDMDCLKIKVFTEHADMVRNREDSATQPVA